MKSRALWLRSKYEDGKLLFAKHCFKCSFIEYSHSARASFSEVAAEPTANPQK